MPYKIFLTCIILILFIVGCKSDKIFNVPEQQEPTDTTDVVLISYEDQVQPIFNNTCGGGPCHIIGSQAGVNLSDYQNTTTSVGDSYGQLVVIPGDASASPLIDKLSDNPLFGRQMPLTGGALTNEEISIIRDWINQGALDN